MQVEQELGAKYAANFAYGFDGRSVVLEPGKSTRCRDWRGSIGRLLSNGLSIDIAIKALEDRGLARRLAQPNLIARSGQKASFLAGGEVPIPVAGDEGAGHRRLQEVRRRPRIHADRACGRPDLSWTSRPKFRRSTSRPPSHSATGISVPGFVVRRAQHRSI